ncbi:hypothetical protein HDU83_005535 [Entophlyctis luteolus]|nr:hypothetical protein HDU83_005535 [Entophlyctis luteolus]KAJ3381365.1 hypothetical protein HDU84_005159 [Entophlyctis sp. JEL0112]
MPAVFTQSIASESSSSKRTVVIAVDSSKYSEYAVNWAAANFLQKDDVAVLVKVQSSQPVVSGELVTSANGDIYFQHASAHAESDTASTSSSGSRLLEKYSELLAAKNFHVETVLAHGNQRKAIVEQVVALKADALILAAPAAEEHGLQRVFGRSDSDYFMRHCQCPVLVAKPSLLELKEMNIAVEDAVPGSEMKRIASDTSLFIALQAA